MEQGKVFESLNSIRTAIDKVAEGNLDADGMFLSALRAALVKNFEFNYLIFSDELKLSAFALNPSLRGLCEDIICLKYINQFDAQDRNEVVHLLSNKQIFLFVEKQEKFFSDFRPSQKVLGSNNYPDIATGRTEAKNLQKKLASFKSKYGWTSRKDWPTVREMAVSTDLVMIYDYLYAVTSSFVHFSPRNLMRMGWGDVKTKDFKYSTQNFEQYYEEFNQFYGIYLFVTFCTNFASILNCKEDLHGTVEELIVSIQDEQRWPELVTFEEMNWFDTNPIKVLMSPFMIVGGENNTKIRPTIWTWT